MAVKLIYKHQQKAYELMKKTLKEKGRAAYIFPTGCGKTFPTLKYMEENPEKSVLIVVPNNAVKKQHEKYIKKYIDNGENRLKSKNIQIVTYQKVSLTKRIAKKLKADTIVLDEIHRAGAETWEPAIKELLESQPNAEVIGMTATPERTDKRNMAYEIFGENVVYEMSLTDALSGEKAGEVVLKTPRYVRVLSQLRGQLEEYRNQIELIEDVEKRERLKKKFEKLDTIISNSPDIQDIMAAGMQKKNGKYIVFCKDREDMLDKMSKVQDIFGKVNGKIHTEYVLSQNGAGDTVGKTSAQNRRTLESFENKANGEELNLLFCVDQLNEGVHIAGIDGEVLFDLTSSPILYKQRIGRVLSSDKEAGETVIIDAVNNWLNQLETYKEIEQAINKGGSRDNTNYDSLGLTPEETDLLDIMREIGEELKYNSYHTYEEIIEWLENHEGRMPRGAITKNGKQLSRKEMREEEHEEIKLYARWLKSQERRILDEYAGIPIEEVPEEYREKIATLRSYGLGKTTYEEIIEWLECHEGQMPRGTITRDGKVLTRKEMREEEHEEIKLYERWIRSQERKILEEYVGILIEEVPEEYREKISKLRSYGLGKTTYEEIIEWLESYGGQMPRASIRKDAKTLIRKEMIQEEKYEVNLIKRWNNSQEKKVLEEYAGRPIEEVPEKYREKIATLRSYGLGMKEKTTYEEIIEWLENHEGQIPRGVIVRNGKKLRQKEISPEEQDEVNLYARWRNSQERRILEEYAGRPIEEVPEKYREKIATLRSYGLGMKEKTTYEEIIEWLESHGGQMPRRKIIRDRKDLTRKEMREEEHEEIKLHDRWRNSQERKILEEYVGRAIEEVPEEYRDKIAILRSYGLGQKEKTTYEQIIEWLENHEGRMPRGAITKNGKQLSRKEMSKEEREEANLYVRWMKSQERKILDEYVGTSIEEVPEEYREKIATLRSYGLGMKEKTAYEEIIEWLENHEGGMPRTEIRTNGKTLTRKEMSPEEQDEVNLRQRWMKSQERKILDEYAGRPIEEVPEEYREKIAKLRSLGQLGKKKDDKLKGRMKKAVANQVGNNAETRIELGMENPLLNQTGQNFESDSYPDFLDD